MIRDLRLTKWAIVLTAAASIAACGSALSAPPAAPSLPRPAGLGFDAAPRTPEAIVSLPREAPSKLFPDPNQAAVDSHGLTFDARRVLDISTLQVSLARYRKANGTYPGSLNELFPSDAPLDEQGRTMTAPPTDPGTHKPYDYQLIYSQRTGGSDYRLGAILSSGQLFAGFPHLGQ